jgi:hypothetical protein
LTIKQSALQKFRQSYDLFQNLRECEVCEMCRPDTHAF